MDDYQPILTKWTGSSDHFGFLNQPTTGNVNNMVLVDSFSTILKTSHSHTQIEAIQREMLAFGKLQFQNSLNKTWRLKTWFHPLDDSSSDWSKLDPLLRNYSVEFETVVLCSANISHSTRRWNLYRLWQNDVCLDWWWRTIKSLLWVSWFVCL